VKREVGKNRRPQERPLQKEEEDLDFEDGIAIYRPVEMFWRTLFDV
jgi:hypothetical protein